MSTLGVKSRNNAAPFYKWMDFNRKIHELNKNNVVGELFENLRSRSIFSEPIQIRDWQFSIHSFGII